MATPPENSRTASVMDTTIDIEKTEPDTLNLRADGEAPKEFVRPISTTSWILVCVGIYLGAILYGMNPRNILIQIMLMVRLKVSIRQ